MNLPPPPPPLLLLLHLDCLTPPLLSPLLLLDCLTPPGTLLQMQNTNAKSVRRPLNLPRDEYLNEWSREMQVDAATGVYVRARICSVCVQSSRGKYSERLCVCVCVCVCVRVRNGDPRSKHDETARVVEKRRRRRRRGRRFI